MRQRPRLFRPAFGIPIALSLLFSSANILLASNQYTAVDGALRCLIVYWRRPPYLGPNNHMLYPVNAWLWWHLASSIGLRAHRPVTFLHTVAAMNAVCAGGSVALVNAVVWRFTHNWKASLIAALVYALSWALLAHATNSAEPVVGLFVSLLAVLAIAEGLVRERPALLFIGGVCLALALANYESMFLVAPLIYLLSLVWSPANPRRSPRERHSPSVILSEAKDLRGAISVSEGCRGGTEARATDCIGGAKSSREIADSGRATPLPIVRLSSIALGTVIGIIAIYGAAYYSLGITTPREMLRAFFRMGGEPEVYAGFRLSKLANLPVGLVDNVVAVLPGDYHGLRWLLGQHKLLSIAGLAAIGAVVASLMAPLALAVWRLCPSRRARVFGLAFVGAFSFELLPLLYWDPIYDKLWLQPLALLSILGGVLACRMDAASARRFCRLVLVVIALEACVNLPQVVFAHLEPTRCLEDASTLAGFVGPQDKVVTDFDPVSSLWMSLYDGQPARTLLFPATSAAVALATLDRWTQECTRSGCRILFVSLLDQPKPEWDAFLANRVKIPFNALNRYRQDSRSLDRFACEDAGLRAYDPAGKQMSSP